MPILGAHVGASGGLHTCVGRAQALGAQTMQIFVAPCGTHRHGLSSMSARAGRWPRYLRRIGFQRPIWGVVLGHTSSLCTQLIAVGLC